MKLIHVVSDILLAQAEPAAAPGGMAGTLTQMLPFVLMFGVLYFLLFRPMNKQRREHADSLSALKKDDEVMTSSGMWGRIVAIDETVATLEIADKVKIRILRDRIGGRWNPGKATATANGAVSAPSPQK